MTDLIAFVGSDRDGEALRAAYADDLAQCRDDAERARWELGYDAAVLRARKLVDDRDEALKVAREALDKIEGADLESGEHEAEAAYALDRINALLGGEHG